MSDNENQLLKDEALWQVQASLFDPQDFCFFWSQKKRENLYDFKEKDPESSSG